MIPLITRLELITSIVGAGVIVASSDPATARTDTLKQHPLGTFIIAVLVTFPYSPDVSVVVPGKYIALLVGRGSPLTVIATAIGTPAVPPAGIPMFPLYVT